ncbi:MAG TPA: class I SAM-dependent RNA methyltransferase [Polyangiales bacterium]|nr:class I SAM-dependent RNA methyltransferase [Polyangiales bacterium]
MEGRVRDVVASGDAVIETSAGIVFARGGLPGETVRVSLDGKPGRTKRGRITSVLGASPSRVEPPCKYAERCGGCSLMHADLDSQRALQRGFLDSALRKAGLSTELRFTVSPDVLGYRSRARLAFRKGQLGFHRGRSEQLIDIDACLVLAPPLQDALTQLRTLALSGEGELSLALGAGGRAVAVIRSDAAQSPALYRAAEALQLAGVALFLSGATTPAQFGDAREWSVGADGQPLEGPIGGFSQANRAVNAALVARVVELAQTEGMRVLELYAGSGNFTVALAGGALSYTAVEQAPDAVRALRQNLAVRSLKLKIVEGDVARALAGPALDVVVLDPPRTGAPGVLPQLVARKPKRIVYVSCDPATLARDLGELTPRGYTLRWAEGFEMFPQTADLESVVLLERDT